MKGWVKLHRKILTSDIFQNEKMLKVFIYCLAKATHKERSQRIGRQIIELKQGQFIFGRKKASIELNMPESTLWDYMSMLKDDEVITIESNNRFSVVTIDNWGFYQSEEEISDSKPTTDEQQMDTNKNVKNVKNDKEDIKNSRKRVYDKSSVHYQLAKRLYDRILENNPGHKEPNLQNWANDVRLMMERDNRSEKQIAYVIDWSQRNDFWKSNILSISKLREKFDQLVIQIKSNREKVVEIPRYEVTDNEAGNEQHSEESGHVRLFR